MSVFILPDDFSFGEWRDQAGVDYLRQIDRGARWSRPAGHRPNLVAWGKRIEAIAATILADRGHQVNLTTHKASFDLWAGSLRVEVKASRWSGHRYQFNTRNGCQLYLLACVGDGGGILGWFVVPARAVAGRANLAIWSKDPAAYHGQWSQYFERWSLADALIEAAGPVPWQLSLWQ